MSHQASGFREDGWSLSSVWKPWGALWSRDCFLTTEGSGMWLGTSSIWGRTPGFKWTRSFFLFICQSVSVSGKEQERSVWYQAGSWTTAPMSLWKLTRCGVAVCQSALRLLVLCFGNTVNRRGAAWGYGPARKKLMFELTWHLMVLYLFCGSFFSSASLMRFFWRYSYRICYACSVVKISFQSVVLKLVSYNLGQWRERMYIELTAFSASVETTNRIC